MHVLENEAICLRMERKLKRFADDGGTSKGLCVTQKDVGGGELLSFLTSLMHKDLT